uniref:Serine/threonine-protein kinase MRCK gamma n=1 Tax=Ursus maritimus TaxID=29073 RepID=A0A452TQF9_URSMA
MLGLGRQGLGCDACGYFCHSACAPQAPPCPVPPDHLRTALGVHPETGTGTAYEGFLSVPRPPGVRRGWQRVFAALSDSRLLLFDAPDPRLSPASGALLQALDLRDPQFSATPVLASDVIHAQSRDLPRIFRVTASQLTVPPAVCTVLLLAESEAERERWLQMLRELQRLLLDTRPRPRPVYTLKEAYDNGLPLLPHALCAAIIGEPPAEEHCPGPAPGRSLGLSGGLLPSPYKLGAGLVSEELPPSRGGLGEALGAVELSLSEFLLLFTTAGVYVDSAGRKSRIHELLWPAVPTGWGYAAPYLTVFSENAIDVFDVRKAEWVQTVPLKKVRPLNPEGSLFLFGTEKVRLTYLRNRLAEKDDIPCAAPLPHIPSTRREMLKDPFVRSKLISPPTNFNHLVHVGPTDGKPSARVLPRAPEGKGRGTRGSGPQRPHSFSEASRRPASVGSDGLAGDADTTVKRKPWTSLSSESVSCPQGSLSPADSLIQVSERPRSLPPAPESEGSP